MCNVHHGQLYLDDVNASQTIESGNILSVTFLRLIGRFLDQLIKRVCIGRFLDKLIKRVCIGCFFDQLK